MTEVVAIIALCISAASFGLLLWNKVMEVRGSWKGASIHIAPWGSGQLNGKQVLYVEMKNLTLLPYYVTSYVLVDCAVTNLEGHPPPAVLSGGETVHLAVDARSDKPWMLTDGYSMRNFRIGVVDWWGLAPDVFDEIVDRQLDQLHASGRLRRIGRWVRRRGRYAEPVTVGPESHLGTAYRRHQEVDRRQIYKEAVEAGGTFLSR